MACAATSLHHSPTEHHTQPSAEEPSTLQRIFTERVLRTPFPQPDVNIFRLFLVTNEKPFSPEQTSSYTVLSSSSPVGDTHVGVSGFFNLNVASIRPNITRIVIIDTSDAVVKFWRTIEPIIAAAHTRQEFLEQTHALLFRDADHYFPTTACLCCNALVFPKTHAVGNLADLEREVTEGTSWLSTDERFTRIQGIFRARHFVITQNDLCQPEEMRAVSAAIRESGGTVDTVYASNVEAYATKVGQGDSFRKALKTLAPGDAYLVDSTRDESGVLHQRVMRASEFLSS